MRKSEMAFKVKQGSGCTKRKNKAHRKRRIVGAVAMV
jgi:hypothetical protein